MWLDGQPNVRRKKKGQKLVKPDVTAKLKIIIIIIKTKPMQTKQEIKKSSITNKRKKEQWRKNLQIRRAKWSHEKPYFARERE
jgi:hypothetical protein